jgi:hypothetical protein
VRPRSLLVFAVLVTSVAVPQSAAARRGKRAKKGPTQIVPTKKTKRSKPAADTDTSEGGTRRGVTELALGSITGAVSLLLIGRGAWEITEVKRLRRECEDLDSSDLGCAMRNPPLHPGLAAGLSFAFAVPLAVASGLLLSRGIRIHRDYKAHRRDAEVALGPWTPAGGGGVMLRGRF